jgi:hypothetical protein
MTADLGEKSAVEFGPSVALNWGEESCAAHESRFRGAQGETMRMPTAKQQNRVRLNGNA